MQLSHSARIFTTTLLLLLSSSPARAETPGTDRLLYTDLRDIAEYAPHLMPDVKMILQSMHQTPAQYFPQGMDFPATEKSKGRVLGIEFVELPYLAPLPSTDETRLVATTYEIRALILSPSESFFFRRYRLSSTGSPPWINQIQILEDLPLNKAQFKIRLGLIDRKLVLEDTENHIKKIYPVAVGGFDEGISASSRGKTVLKTPLFFEGSISRKTTTPSKKKPEYYQGQPSMPITRKRGNLTPFAFHITMGSKLLRGFESHGCIRLRKKDLRELFYILFQGGLAKMQVDVRMKLETDSEDHPFPLRTDGYATVVNCAPHGQPTRSCRDPEDPKLTWMVDVKRPQPIDKLQPVIVDSIIATELTGVLP